MLFPIDDDTLESDEPTDLYTIETRARALLVEDDEDLRELIAMRMRREGFQVEEGGSGHEALAVLAAIMREPAGLSELDVLVMDVRMPGPSGLEIARWLRAAEPALPVLLITAYPDHALRAEASRLGVTVLAKPFALDQLSEVVIATMLDTPMLPPSLPS